MKLSWRWLYPGMGVKRWILVFAAGAVLSCLGLVGLLGRDGRFLVVWLLDRMAEVRLGRAGWAVVGGVGLWCMWAGARRLARSVREFLPRYASGMAEFIYRRRQLERGPRVVAIGGGTGLSVLLRGLKEYTSNITAIVTVTDDGGSSGRLRGELRMPPPGDIRNCLVALADTEPLMERLFQHRFSRGRGLAGHSFGNLFIAAMTEATGDFEKAVKESSKVLAVRGRVLPLTLENVALGAELASGQRVEGETLISRKKEENIKSVYLIPPDCRPLPEAIEAIEDADLVVLGPGSLYTSVLPNLLVAEVREALARTRAVRVYVCNVMTQAGETDGYKASDHLRAIVEHAGNGIVDYVILNTAEAPAELLDRYALEGSYPVEPDAERVRLSGVTVIEDRLLSATNFVRHDPHRLARAVIRAGSAENGRGFTARGAAAETG